MRFIRILLLIACMVLLATGAYATWTFEAEYGYSGQSCQLSQSHS